jgi:2-oxo-4-hydroxy-4-carboxy-5-ureidoimidazoline decarboxylase
VLPGSPGIDALNRLDDVAATSALLRCCGASAWAHAMSAARPFEDRAALLRLAEATWWSLPESAWLEAFAAHPRIGARPGEHHGRWASGEQASTAAAGGDVITALADANHAYAERHGFIYIVCASGRSAADMLADLHTRIAHNRATEIRIAAEEQAKITRLRLDKLLKELAP